MKRGLGRGLGGGLLRAVATSSGVKDVKGGVKVVIVVSPFGVRVKCCAVLCCAVKKLG